MAPVRSRSAGLGLLGVDGDLECRRLRRAADEAAGDPAGLPYAHRRASAAHLLAPHLGKTLAPDDFTLAA
jgi:hypothetical protein